MSLLDRLPHLPATAAAVTATALAGSVASRAAASPWYRRLDKPAFTPPPAAFPIAWTSLYADLAATAAFALGELEQTHPSGARAYRRALAANLVLNASWSWVFFGARTLGPATAVAAALTVSSADLARRTAAASPAAGLAQAAYPAWCAFATVLSAEIWRRNRG